MSKKEAPATKFMHKLSIISVVDRWAVDFPEDRDELSLVAGCLLSDLTPTGQRQLAKLSSNPRVHLLEWGNPKKEHGVG